MRRLAAVLLAFALPCCDGTVVTQVTVALLYPEGQRPLEGAYRLDVSLLAEEELDPLDPIPIPSSGSWDDLDVGVSLGGAAIEGARVHLEGIAVDGTVQCVGESVEVPLAVGRPGRVSLLLAATGEAGLVPALEAPAAGHAAAYLAEGGVLLAGGEVDAVGAAVYALDVYEPVELEPLPAGRSEAVALPTEEGGALVLGGSPASDDAVLYDSVNDRWDAVPLPEELSGEWPRPATSRSSSGGVIAVRGRWVARISGGAAPTAFLVGMLPEGLAAGTVSVMDDGVAVAVGAGEPAAAGIELSTGEVVEVPAPPSGPRSGHAAVVLADGSLVVLAGEGEAGPVEDVEVLDPERAGWASLEGLLAGHGPVGGEAVLLPDDRIVLVCGRTADGAPAAEALVVDAPGRDVERIPLEEPRAGCSATLLPWGGVLVVGGAGAAGDPLASVELVLPAR